MTKDEALDLALRALRFARDDGYENEISQQAITAIKQARSAPVHKPYRPLQDNGSQYFGDSWDIPPAAQRQWVGLTQDEADKIYKDGSTFGEMMRMVEAKLKEKNNG